MKETEIAKEKMTKYKCDVCGEKHSRDFIIMECSNCYLKGCKIELNKQRRQFLKVIQKLKKEWKAKCKRMEVMSGEVADYELRMLIQDVIGEKLVK